MSFEIVHGDDSTPTAIAGVSGSDEYVIVSKREPTAEDLNEAQSRYESIREFEGWIPMIFLDLELDTPDMRAWLQSEAISRFRKAQHLSQGF